MSFHKNDRIVVEYDTETTNHVRIGRAASSLGVSSAICLATIVGQTPEMINQTPSIEMVTSSKAREIVRETVWEEAFTDGNRHSGASSSDLFSGGFYEALNDRFIIDELEPVLGYLARHPRLVELLYEVSSKVRDYFGSGAQIRLSTWYDSDDDGDQVRESLAAEIIPAPETTDSLDTLIRFYEEWWNRAYRMAEGTLDVWTV